MAKTKAEGFTTQAEILRQNNDTKSIGLCTPLSNLYADWRMGLGTRTFLETSAAETYKLAKEMEQKQDTLRANLSSSLFEKYSKSMDPKNAEFNAREAAALLSLHYAYYNNHVLFNTKREPISTMEKAQGIKSSVGDSEHVMVNYPTGDSGLNSVTTPQSHQVYFGADYATNRCYYFNSNLPRSEKVGPCAEVLELMAQDIKHNAAKDGRPCLVSYSIPNPFKLLASPNNP
ncbi:MAG: hypothetical protein WC627_10000 [Legionella sp.]|jgi:hypothetical protein